MKANCKHAVCKQKEHNALLLYENKMHMCNVIAKELASFLLLNCMHAENIQSCAIVLQPS